MAQKRTGKRDTRAGMTRPRPAPVAASPPARAAEDWKDHKVIIAGGSAAAGFGLALAFFTGIVMPNQTAKLENEVRELKATSAKDVREFKATTAKQAEVIKKLRSDLATVTAELKNTSSDLYQSRFTNFLARIAHTQTAFLLCILVRH